MAWERVDGDRIPYPLAVRASARDTAQRAARLPELIAWCDRVLDADLEAALRVLARPTVRLEVYGECADTPESFPTPDEIHSTAQVLGAEPTYGTIGATAQANPAANTPAPPGLDARARDGRTPSRQQRFAAIAYDHERDAVRAERPTTDASPVRVLGAAAGHIAVVAAQQPGSAADRGGDVRLLIGGPKSLAARVISALPGNSPGGLPRLSAPLPRVREDSRDLVTMPVAGPAAPARIRRLFGRPRAGIGQIVVSTRRPDADLKPFGVLCWIDVAGDGRYAVRTGADVDVTPVDAEGFTAQLRPMLNAAGRCGVDAARW
nr:ESX secretion-associated protein EspG [Nocardia bovistercoris]